MKQAKQASVQLHITFCKILVLTLIFSFIPFFAPIGKPVFSFVSPVSESIKPASALEQEQSEKSAHVKLPTGPHYAKDRIIVKYKDSVTSCVAGLVKSRRRFKDATADRSDSLDQLFSQFGITDAAPVFRTEAEKKALARNSFGALSVTILRKMEELRTQRIQKKFPARTARAAKNSKPRSLYHVYRHTLPEGTNIEQAVAAFKADPHVEYAQPAYEMTAYAIPNDPYYASSGSWGQPYDDLWGLKKIHSAEAWDVSQGAGVVVGVIDTGVDYNHPDLAANIWHQPNEIPLNGVDDDGNGYIDDVMGWDFYNDDNNPIDDHGHGTHVSGTIAAVGNNNLGIIGVAPAAKIMPVKALNQNGGSSANDRLAAALVYAAENGADVLNNSWGCFSACPSNPVIEDAVAQAYQLGSVVVFAAGNATFNVIQFSPQNMQNPKPVVVAATTENDVPAFFSNFGTLVDVTAPGGGSEILPGVSSPFRNVLSLKSTVHSSGMTGSGSFVVNGSYLRQAGTSMAAPHVVGAAALLLSHYPSFTPEQVRQALRLSADDIGVPGFDQRTGAGRLNTEQALTIEPPSDVQAVISSPSLPQIWTGTQGTIEIYGTAAGSDFANYQLLYNADKNAGARTPISPAVSQPITNGLLGSWDITNIPTGRYTVVLAVMSQNGQMFYSAIEISIEQDIQRITNNTGWVYKPDISGNLIVWEDGRYTPHPYPGPFPEYNQNDNVEIFLYDLATHTEQQITDNPAAQILPRISGERIVWLDYRHSPTRPSIYLFDLATNTEQLIVSPVAHPGFIDIDGDLIVWDQYVSGLLYEIHLYDLATNTEIRFSAVPRGNRFPSVSGNRVVWQAERANLNSWDIAACIYDRAAQACPSVLITNDPEVDITPAVSGNTIVWVRYNVNYGNLGIFSHDFSTGITQPMSNPYFFPLNAAVDNTWVVWEESEDFENRSDIFLHDMETHTQRAVTANFLNDAVSYPRVSGKKVVWAGYQNGTLDLYAYAPNQSPTLQSIGTIAASAGSPITIPVSAGDSDHDAITLTVERSDGQPMGTLGESFTDHGDGTGTFSWTPSANNLGMHFFIFTASDGKGGTASEAVTVNVVMPWYFTSASASAATNAALRFQVYPSAQHPGGNVTVTVDPATMPANAYFFADDMGGGFPGNYIFFCAPVTEPLGPRTIRFIATDGNAVSTFSVTVNIVEPPIGGELSFDGTPTVVNGTVGHPIWVPISIGLSLGNPTPGSRPDVFPLFPISFPENAVFYPEYNQFIWDTPTQAGQYEIVFAAFWGSGAGTHKITFNITEPPPPERRAGRTDDSATRALLKSAAAGAPSASTSETVPIKTASDSNIQSTDGGLNAAPQAFISIPLDGETINQATSLNASVLGTAAGTNFDHYQLFYSLNTPSPSWTPIGVPVTTPVESNLLGIWRVNILTEGNYLLSLVVTLKDGSQTNNVINVSIVDEPPNDGMPIGSPNLPKSLPAISGNFIAYAVDANSEHAEVRVYDISAGTEQIIASDEVYVEYVDVSGNNLLWNSYDFKSGRRYAYHYNLVTKSKKTLPIYPHLPFELADLDGDNLIYVPDSPSLGGDVFLYNLTTGEDRRLTDWPGNQTLPVISGNMAAWVDEQFSPLDSKIYLYDLTTQIGRYIATQRTIYNLSIDGNLLAWSGPSGSYTYDIALDLKSPVLVGDYPKISSKNWLILSTASVGYTISAYYISLQQQYNLQDLGIGPSYDIFENLLVWQDDRNDPVNTDIRLLDLCAVANCSPILNPVENHTITADSLLTIPITASDPNNDMIALTAEQSNGQPISMVGATFTDHGNGTGTFFWTPTTNHLGINSFNFKATDGQGNTINRTGTVDVATPWYLTSAPLSVSTGAQLSFQVYPSAQHPGENVALIVDPTTLPANAYLLAENFDGAFPGNYIFFWAPVTEPLGPQTIRFIARYYPDDGGVTDTVVVHNFSVTVNVTQGSGSLSFEGTPAVVNGTVGEPIFVPFTVDLVGGNSAASNMAEVFPLAPLPVNITFDSEQLLLTWDAPFQPGQYVALFAGFWGSNAGTHKITFNITDPSVQSGGRRKTNKRPTRALLKS